MNYAYYVWHYMEFELCSITQLEINLDDKTPIKVIRYNDVEHHKK